MLHRCGRNAEDFWPPSEACPQCIGALRWAVGPGAAAASCITGHEHRHDGAPRAAPSDPSSCAPRPRARRPQACQRVCPFPSRPWHEATPCWPSTAPTEAWARGRAAGGALCALRSLPPCRAGRRAERRRVACGSRAEPRPTRLPCRACAAQLAERRGGGEGHRPGLQEGAWPAGPPALLHWLLVCMPLGMLRCAARLTGTPPQACLSAPACPGPAVARTPCPPRLPRVLPCAAGGSLALRLPNIMVVDGVMSGA